MPNSKQGLLHWARVAQLSIKYSKLQALGPPTVWARISNELNEIKNSNQSFVETEAVGRDGGFVPPQRWNELGLRIKSPGLKVTVSTQSV